MIISPLVNQIFVILIVIADLLLGFWVFFSDRKAKINRYFLLMAIFLCLWIIFCYLGNISKDQNISFFLGRLAYGIVALFLIPFYLFFINFLEEDRKFFTLKIVIFILSFLLFFLSVFTSFMVKGMIATVGGMLPVLGGGKFLYFTIISFVELFIIFRLSLNYYKYPPNKKIKVQYFLIGSIIFLVANLIFNVILPFLEEVPLYYYVGNYSVIFFIGFTGFAIVRRDLFGTKVILTDMLVAVIALLLLVQIFTAQSTAEYIWRIVLLILFLIFGYLLVKSVVKEIEYREQLQNAYDKLQRLDKSKSEFISIASHQLRTPLTAIKGYVSMILDNSYGKISAKLRGIVERIYSSNERLIRLVNDLLNVSRVEMGKMELEPKMASLEETISNVVEEIQLEAKRKNIYLKFEKPEQLLPKVFIDQEKIRHALVNVIDNAIKYTQKGGITIKTKKLDSKIRIEIQDTGEGMNREELAKLFGTFSRGEAGTKLYTEGAGIGLHIAKLFIEMHQGRIWAESEVRGKGSVFYIELPFKDWQTVEFLGNI